VVIDEALDPGCDMVAGDAGELLVRQQNDARMQHVVAGSQPGHRVAEPADDTVRPNREVAVAAGVQSSRPCLEFEGESFLRRRLNSLRIGALHAHQGRKAEPCELSRVMPLNEDIAIHTDFSFQHRILSQALHEHRCPAINKAFRQPFM